LGYHPHGLKPILLDTSDLKLATVPAQPYSVPIGMPPRFYVPFFFLDSGRVIGDNMVKLVVMGDHLIDQGAFYAGR
jgi:hypothetical protein